MRFTDEQIAEVCHGANFALQAVLGDPAPSQPWAVETAETRESMIEGVRAARRGTTPRESHENWMRFKTGRGWRYGQRKDPLIRTHPCLLPYDELPPGERLKDTVFLAVVTTMVTAG